MSFDYDALDPGIRNVVRMLHAWGYETTDSGDGVTKVGDMECALPYPHVAICASGPVLAGEADVLCDRLRRVGLKVDQMGPDPAGSVSIQASYDPASRTAIIELMGLNDARMVDARVFVSPDARVWGPTPSTGYPAGTQSWAVVP